MENALKVFGACIVIAAVILAAAIFYHARTGRYQFQPSNPPGVIWTLDTVTGDVKTSNG